MPFASLGEFVEALRKAGELHEVAACVDPRLEITEITDRVVKAGGPALLFTDVKGSRFPVLTNQFGTQRRMAMALEARNLDDVAARVRRLDRHSSAVGLVSRKASRRWLRLAPLDNAIPRHRSQRQRPGCRRRRPRSYEAAGADDLAARRRPVHHAARW